MASYTQSMTLGGPALTKTIGLSDANAQRIIAAHRGILDAPQGATAQQVWDRIVQRSFDIIKADTMNYERAQQQAAVVVGDIPEI